MSGLLLRWALDAAALGVVAELLDSIRVQSIGSALAGALLLGLVNASIRPLLALVTLPITLLTLGLFSLVLNGLLFWLVSALLPGFDVDGFGGAFFGALLYSALTWLVSLALRDD